MAICNKVVRRIRNSINIRSSFINFIEDIYKVY